MTEEVVKLPFIDEHTIRIPASRDAAWTALHDYATRLGFGPRSPVPLLLGTEPRSGFEVAQSVPGESITLAGRHRFSHYRLVFALEDAGDGSTTLSARSYATFPGLHGRAYRTLVIGSGGHVVATRSMLRTIRRRTQR